MRSIGALEQAGMCIIAFLAATVTIVLASAGSELPFDAPSIMARLQGQRQSLPPSVIRVETTDTWRTANEQGTGMSMHELRWEGARVDVIMEEYNHIEGETRVLSGSKRGIWNGQQYIFRQKMKGTHGEDGPVTAAFSSKNARAEGLITSPYSGGFLSGYIGEKKHICDVLKEASMIVLKPATENVNDNPCYVLAAEIKGRQYTLWLDATRGFSIRRVVIDEIGQGSVPVKTVVDDVEVDEIDGHWIAVSGSYTVTSGTDSQRFVSKRTDIKFNPDFEEIKAFEMDGIPNGTRIRSMDFPGIGYIWRDGQIVSDVGDKYLSDLDRSISETAGTLKYEPIPLPETDATPASTKPDSPVARPIIGQSTGVAGGGKHDRYSRVLPWLGLFGIGALIAGWYIRRRLSCTKQNP